MSPNRTAGFHLLVNSSRITDKETLEKKARMVKEIEKYMKLNRYPTIKDREGEEPQAKSGRNQIAEKKEENLVLLEDAGNDQVNTERVRLEPAKDKDAEKKFREGGPKKITSLLENIDLKDQAVDKALKVIHEDIDHIFQGMVNKGDNTKLQEETHEFFEKKRRSRSLHFKEKEVESFEKNEELSKIMDTHLDIDTDFKAELKKDHEPRSALVPKEKMHTLDIFKQTNLCNKPSERIVAVDSKIPDAGRALRRCQTKAVEDGKDKVGLTPKHE